MTPSNDSTLLHETTLAVFVQSIMHYFDHMAGLPAEIGTPYLLEGEAELLDVTAVIGVTGDLQGCVFYTAPIPLLDELLRFIGEYEPSDSLRCDMNGEVANTFTGNARRRLGPGFMISVPVVFLGLPKRLVWPKNTSRFVIPIMWQEKRSLLIVCLGDAPPTLDFA
jgi:chemotaxis protein CheX